MGANEFGNRRASRSGPTERPRGGGNPRKRHWWHERIGLVITFALGSAVRAENHKFHRARLEIRFARGVVWKSRFRDRMAEIIRGIVR